MSLEEAVVEKLRTLPAHARREVLDFVEFLATRKPPKEERCGAVTSLRRIKGLCADLDMDLDAADFRAARRELWAGFPRERST